MTKTAFITGITGQIGSFLAEILLENQYHVYGLVRGSSVNNTTRLSNILGNRNLQIVNGDITDGACLTKIIQAMKPDEIYNLAAESSVATSFQEPCHTWDVTAKGFLNLLEAAKYVFPQCKIFQASSSEIFGDSCFHQYGEYLDVRRYQNEETSLRPKNPYAVAKAAAHQLARVYREAYGLYVSCGIFYPNESSRRGDNFLTRKVTKYIGKLVRDTSPVICNDTAYWMDKQSLLNNYPKLKLGNINAYKNFGHAKDYANAAYLIMQQKEPSDYIISNSYPRTVKEFIEKSFSYMNLDYKNFIEIDKSLYRPLDNNVLIESSATRLTKLGWIPKLSFEDIISEMVEYDIKNP